MSVGVLAHLFGKIPYAELAKKVRSYGFDYVQLALSKAISDVDCGLGKLNPGMAYKIGEQFAKNNVKIAVLGCYMNFIDPDEEKYRANIEYFKEHLRNARDFGASIVATETGVPTASQNAEQEWPRLKAAIEQIAEEAEKWGVYIGLEAANRHVIDTADKLAAMIEQVPSSNIGVVLDPCNIMTEQNFANQDQVMEHAFELLGRRIVSMHAKDILPQADGKLEIVGAGLGKLNYPLFIHLANQYKPETYITLERIEQTDMEHAITYIQGLRRG